MERVISFLNGLYPVSCLMEAALRDACRFTRKKKYEFLVFEGEVCRYAWYLQKGLVRCYYNRDEREVTTWFMEEDHVIVLFKSLFGQKESLYNIQAVEANGNIKRMQQWGLKIGGSTQIDDLTYNYAYSNMSNKLLNVADAFNDNQTKLGDFRISALNPAQTKTTTTVDYSYDDNGNMVKDLNKDLVTYGEGDGIQYNYLNLPTIITVKKDNSSNKGTITYTYDAAGNKLKKQTIDYSTSGKTITTTTTYINGFVYESKITTPANTPNDDYTDKLQFVPDEEGRIRPTGNTIQPWAFDYFIKDHLGNVRMVLTDEQKINYYPAATVEGTYSPTGTTQANSMVNYEKNFYRIDNTKITPETSTYIPSWPTETLANTKLYYNNNSRPSSNVAPVTPSNLSYPTGCTPTQLAGSNNLYKLNATSNKTGLEFMIKVMAGDHIDIFGKSYYLNTTNITNTNSTTLDVLSLMTDMLLSPGNAAAAKGITASQLNTTKTRHGQQSDFNASDSFYHSVFKQRIFTACYLQGTAYVAQNSYCIH